MHSKPRIVVAGAGAFGGWTALELLRSGARVTLVERRDAGNALSSSGGESRVIRHVYAARHHVELARRALELWDRADHRWGRRLLHRKGVLFMAGGESILPAAVRHMRACDVAFEELDRSALESRYPQIACEGLDSAVFEPASGYLDARRACEAVRDAFIAEGGEYQLGTLLPGKCIANEMQGVRLAEGGRIIADQYVFACGPWLKSLFEEPLGSLLRVTRQELYFFQPPEEGRKALIQELPVWADVGARFWYGIPGENGLFKIADDTHGEEVNPETQSREPGRQGIERARQYMERRFPGMRGAKYVDARVCQYTLSPDADFVLDCLPNAENAWLMGAGSGHGFKHGPAIGELAAAAVLGRKGMPAHYRLARFDGGAFE